ncbi:cytochrome c oxidase accessory protein CcoG [Tabrizicola oligotrophica]|uniref:Cytochrome c oxidase accessory protein CcoG n=1 Tax=Tabrizicola oligotrophica TaxID=2710650 RepID=A0A6M0QQF0_9RHOB|nr:cytochrome c oxidase accessory protein CcoG [Tabrizicola oligotrophica]NEY89715.1 cytochrome c oxidase accessory protein CcoG [Tabrizicola oligotrophica]
MSTPSTNEPSLYAAREPIFPRRVKGQFRTLKWWLMAVLLGIYYITPWIRWDRGPNLPDQAVLIDMANRRFFFFMIEIWPHEFYFVAGLLIMAGLGLFLFTSAAGRVWCGYACPQTVWTDLFILVERWVEGDRNARIRLHRQQWNGEKIRKRLVKWAIWFAIAIATGGAWIFYFTDAPALFWNLLDGTAHPIAYTTMFILAATTFAFGGFAREQMCIYACPWPRIQAAMMDEDTLTIGYREWRGEPRGKQNVAGNGDCIDCMACVNVCPMGIDIRNGQQLACITCGLCIDACNDMMDKIGKPRGLIGYLALTDETRERDGKPPKSVWSHVFRVRTIIYTSLWSLVGIALVVALFLRTEIDVNVTPVRNPQFVVLKDGSIRNTYEMRLRNKHGEDHWFAFSATTEGGDIFVLTLEGEDSLKVKVPANETRTQRLYVTAPAEAAAAAADRTEFRLWIEDLGSDTVPGTDRVHHDTVFNGKVE